MNKNQTSHCPFCLESQNPLIFYQNNLFLATYNKAPILPGHTLVVPQRHVTRFDALRADELSNLLIFTKKVNQILKGVFRVDAFNWTLQDGHAAGQSINHLHLHIIPRVKDDLPDPGDWYPRLAQSEANNIDSNKRPTHSHDELLQITDKLRQQASMLYGQS